MVEKPMKDQHLSPRDVGRLAKLLNAAFSFNHLSFLLLDLNKVAANIYPPNAVANEACRLIVMAANYELWWRDMVIAMRFARPTHEGIRSFADDFGLSLPAYDLSSGRPVELNRLELEATVRQGNPHFDPAVFSERMQAVTTQVCRVECPSGTALGTGFLVGPDVVMTNYHVVKAIIDEPDEALRQQRARRVTLRFDYKVLPDGVTVGQGKAVKLHADWLIDHSPYSPHDIEQEPSGDPAPDHLDYALLRLEQPIGSSPVLDHVPDAPRRGWIRLAAAADMPDFAKQRALLIMQHPDGRPVKLAIDMDSVIEPPKTTRLRYRTNTEPGSSGSPCFSADWTCVALHHAGDPKYRDLSPARYNQGILIPAIVERLVKRGKIAMIEGE